jgi:SCY1-like protein 2
MYCAVLCCSDPAVHALQFLDVINMKDSTQKAHFYRNTLKDVLLYIPKVSDVIAR